MEQTERTEISDRPLLTKGPGAGLVQAMLDAATRDQVTVHAVRRNISVLEGSGGNSTVLTGKDGKLVVDAGFAVSRRKVASALASIDTDLIKHLINTHRHTDHTDGNAWLHAAGAEITAHENTRKRLSAATRVEGWEWTFPAAPVEALPVDVFATEQEQRSEPDYSKNKTYQQGQREGQTDRTKNRDTARSVTLRKTTIREPTKLAMKRDATTSVKA